MYRILYLPTCEYIYTNDQGDEIHPANLSAFKQYYSVSIFETDNYHRAEQIAEHLSWNSVNKCVSSYEIIEITDTVSV